MPAVEANSDGTVPAATITQWRERRHVLNKRLLFSPDNEWAWLWRVRVQILDYLLARYSEDRDPDAFGRWRPDENTPPGATEALSIESYASAKTARSGVTHFEQDQRERSRNRMRQGLKSIAEATNAERKGILATLRAWRRRRAVCRKEKREWQNTLACFDDASKASHQIRNDFLTEMKTLLAPEDRRLIAALEKPDRDLAELLQLTHKDDLLRKLNLPPEDRTTAP